MSTFTSIALGTAPNDQNGTDARAAGQILNDNFDLAANKTEDNTFTADNTFSGVLKFLGATGEYIKAVVNSAANSARTGYSFWGLNVSTEQEIARITSIQTADADSGSLNFFTKPVAGAIANTFVLNTNGNILSLITYNTTTANAADLNVASGTGQFLRSTSSEKMKDEIQPISLEYSGKIFDMIDACIFYKSKCAADNKEHTFYGISAEQLAEIEPRLVSWGYWPEDYDTIIEDVETEKEYIDNKGKKQTKIIITAEQKQVLKADAEMSPTGVQYSKFVPLMLVEMNRMNDKINDLEQRLLALENN